MRGYLIPLIAVIVIAALLTWLGRDDEPRTVAARSAAPSAAIPVDRLDGPTSDPVKVSPQPSRESPTASIELNVPPTIVDPNYTFHAPEPRVRGGAELQKGGSESAGAHPATGMSARAVPEPKITRVHYAEPVAAERGGAPYANADAPALESPTSVPVRRQAEAARRLPPELEARLDKLKDRYKQARSRERDLAAVASTSRLIPAAELLGAPARQRLTIRRKGAVRVLNALRADGVATLKAEGVVEYDPTSVYDVNITASGLVKDIYFYEGTIIRKGQPLMNMFAPERLLAQYNHLANLSNDDRLSYSFAPGQYLEDSRSNLRWWGMTDDEIEVIEQAQTVLEDYVIPAPRTGYVLERRADRGSLVNAGAREMEDWALVGDTVARVADLSEVWVTAEFAMDDMAVPLPFGALEPGHAVTVTIGETAGGVTYPGTVDHVFANLSRDTRRTRVRVVLKNPDLELLPGMYASLTLELNLPEALRVPRSALLYGGGNSYVLVPQGADDYALTRVVTGARHDGMVSILAGIEGGARVVENARMLVDPDRELLWAAAEDAR